MATIMDYLATEFATFDEKPLNEVDSLVFSQLAMVRMAESVPLHEGSPSKGSRLLGALKRSLGCEDVQGARFADLLRAERYATMFTGLVPERVKELLLAVAASPRFRTVLIHDYASVFSEAESTQFAAVSFTLPGRFTYLAFRGTDKYLASWKENFDMAYAAPVPAQEAALRYVEEVAQRVGGPLVLGGHSKGGNLAAYAAAKASPRVASRLTAVFDHDGPGFPEDLLDDAERARLQGVLRKTVPQESLVGLLMDERGPYRVVESGGRGLEQHSPFTWRIEQGPEGASLVLAEGLAPTARFTAEVLNAWIAGMDAGERRRAVNALFAAIEASGAEDAFDVLMGGPKAIGLLAEAARKTPPGARNVIIEQMKSLAAIAAKKALRLS